MRQRTEEVRNGGLEGVFGADTVGAFRAGTSVQVYRVEQQGKGVPLPGRPNLRIIDQPVSPSKDWVKRFRAAIENKDNHGWGKSYKCGFNPGVVVRATGGAKPVDILFCFGCTELSFDFADTPGLKKQSFAPGRPTFLKLFREVFPKDQVLKSLKEQFDPRGH